MDTSLSPAPTQAPAPGTGGGVPSPALTSVFVRMRLSLLRNGLRQSTGRQVAFVISIVLAVVFAALQLLGLLVLRGNAHATEVTVVLAGLLALGWAVTPLFFPGGDETLDPTRLTMLPLRPGPLVTALLAASLVGIGPLVTLLLGVGAVVAPAHGAAAWLTAALALPLLILVCVALARSVAAANVRLLTSRRGRDLALISGLGVAVGAQFVNLGIQKLSEPDGLSALEPYAAVLGWLPPGSAVAAIDSAADGAYAVALARLAISGAGLWLLLRWWRHSLTRLMTSPDESTLPHTDKAATVRARRGPGALFPDGRTGAVMLRTLRYAWRDPKTRMGWASALGLGALLPVVFALQGNDSVYSVFWASGLLGMMMYNQFGQDYSGFWLVASTISTARDARRELRARMLALALIAAPYMTLVVVAGTLLTGERDRLTEMLGLSAAVLGALFATGALASERFPYSIPADDIHRNVAAGQGSLAYLSLLGGMLCAGLLCAPVIVLDVWLHTSTEGGPGWQLLAVGAAYGVALCAVALRLVSRRVVRRLPEILTAVSKG
ncbi:transporter [Streptomyces sp. AJS327]|uniref:transporter n=1 Tax=Streptomyces sp. AJS327 TaxID=2545265 RepID=UPI0015DD5CDA|nr:transporter [Streptomyces sp. AJS327]MBA0053259.1 transporter [Streptomyces sp. AJS327]